MSGPPKGGAWPGFRPHPGHGHRFVQVVGLPIWLKGARKHPPPWVRLVGHLFFGLGLRGLLSLRLGFRPSWLGGRLSWRVGVPFAVGLLFGLGGLLTCSCSLLLLPMGHCMRGIQQMPLNPKVLLFPSVFHPDSPPPPLPQLRLQPPGRHHRCRAHTPVHQAGGQVTHPPPNMGVPRAAFAAAAASPSPPSHVHGGVRGPTMSCCPIRRTGASKGGGILGCVRLDGGRARGLGFPAKGGEGLDEEVLRGLPGMEGLNPQLDIRISSSTHPSHPNTPRHA